MLAPGGEIGRRSEWSGLAVEARERAGRLLPRLKELEPHSAWLGFRPGIRGDEPAMYRVEGTPLWLAYGHFRNGILLAPVSAERICRAMTGLEAAGWKRASSEKDWPGRRGSSR